MVFEIQVATRQTRLAPSIVVSEFRGFGTEQVRLREGESRVRDLPRPAGGKEIAAFQLLRHLRDFRRFGWVEYTL